MNMVQPQIHGPNNDAWAVLAAAQLYQQVITRRWRARIWALLTGRSRSLPDLAAVEANSRIMARHFAGVQPVPIKQIRGSASKGRSRDFDVDFYPNQDHDEYRWRSVAAAWLYGQAFAPIEVIQVGQTYYVQDGHHRVSIARALGQGYIDAEVTVWEVAEAQPAVPSLQPGDCLAPA
jgi:hypothetical protein